MEGGSPPYMTTVRGFSVLFLAGTANYVEREVVACGGVIRAARCERRPGAVRAERTMDLITGVETRGDAGSTRASGPGS